MKIERINGYGPEHECDHGGGHLMSPPRMRSVRERPNSIEARALEMRDGFLRVALYDGREQWLWHHEAWDDVVKVGDTVLYHDRAKVVSDSEMTWLRAVCEVAQFDAWEARRIARGYVRRCGECGSARCSDPATCPWLTGDFDMFDVLADMGDDAYVVDLDEKMGRIVERGGTVYPAQRIGSIAAMGQSAYWNFEVDVDLEELAATATRDPDLNYGMLEPRRERPRGTSRP